MIEKITNINIGYKVGRGNLTIIYCYNNQPNSKLCCFSTITETFLSVYSPSEPIESRRPRFPNNNL